MKRSLFAVVLALTLCLVTVSAFAVSWEIDPAQIKAYETSDTFAVKVTGKVVTDDALTTGTVNSANDLLAIDVTNSTDGDISNVVLYIVGHTAENKTVELQNSIAVHFSTEKEIEVVSSEITIAAGATGKINVAVDHTTFTGVRAIVASYTDASGRVISNANAEAWKCITMGGAVYTSGSEAADAAAAADFGMVVTSTIGNPSVTSSLNACDSLTFIVKNTGVQDVTEVSVVYMGFTADGHYQAIKDQAFEVVGINATESISIPYVTSTSRIAAGDSAVLTMMCNLKVPNILAYVSQYTTADGQVHTNPNAEALQYYSVSGLTAGTALD